MGDLLRYVYVVTLTTEPYSEADHSDGDSTYIHSQTEELGIFESLEDANDRAKLTLERLGFDVMEMIQEQEIYWDDNGCLGMLEGVGE